MTLLTIKLLLQEVAEILLGACHSGDLMLISHALNGFYDIYSEANYNEVLVSSNVISMMKQGLGALSNLYN